MILPAEIYRAVFEAASDAILLLKGGRIVEANASAGRLFAGKREALAGQAFTALFPAIQPDGQASAELVAASSAVALGGTSQRLPLVCQRADESTFAVEVTLSAALTEGGQAVDLIASIRERADSDAITWTLAEFEANRRAFLESLPGLVMTVDRESKIRTINRFLGGFTAEQIIGASAFDFVMPDFHETVRRAFEQVFRTGQGTRYETSGPASAEGGTAWYTVYVSPIRRGDEVTALTLVTEEITERKRLEQELLASLERLQGYADELEGKNRQLAEENAERKRTEAALRAQREVISRLSTPIIKAWEGVLVLPIIGALDSERAAHMMERLLADIARTRSRFAVLDLTGVEVVDSETVGYIVNVVRAANLLGSRCLVSGISPSVARAMVALGSDMGAFPTFGQMQDALRYALAASGVHRVKTGEAAAAAGEGRAGR